MSREQSEQVVYLSKSLFIRGLQCHKSLYLHKYKPELKDEVPEERQRSFEIGYDVGSLAQQLFPGGVNVPYDGLSHSEQIDMTRSLIDQGVETIYEAAFSHNGVFVKADILHHEKSGWEIYEVKSSVSVKEDYHYDDAAVQHYVISGAGLPVTKTSIVHINTEYVRSGEIEVRKLFKVVDITDIVKDKRPFVEEELRQQQAMLRADEPAIDIGPHCDTPFACDFKGHCWSHIPSPSVFDYAGLQRVKCFSLYRQGIVKMEDLPPDCLGWRQAMQLDGYLHHKNHVNVDSVRTFIESLWYPLCFMDFETTFMVPIPMYNGTRPYQQVPFQYSVHIIHEPGGELEHHEFLADGAMNPQAEFLDRLLSIVPPDACTLVWNQSFEIPRLKELADALPERRTEIERLIGNIRDLMVPFRDRSYYHWRFNGFYTIKVVLPALILDLSYDQLEISDGGTASAEWLRMIRSNDKAENSMIRNNLLRYCEMDTYAEFRILEELRKLT